jgi:hypothetical protein
LPPIPPAPTPPTYPPIHVVNALWEATDSVLAHEEACAYLWSRGLDPEIVSRRGRCRYLPKGAPFPSEIKAELRDAIPKIERDNEWKHAPLYGFRLAFPLLDSMGAMRSIQLRRIEDHGEKIRAKSVALKPQKRGLVLANRAGLALLRRDPEQSKLWEQRPLEVVIVEGEPDFLVASCEEIGEDRVRVVFGIIGSGSWTDAHAIAIPKGAHVIIATDDDIPGNVYAEKIADTLEGRSVSRWKPRIEGQDVCDAGGLAGGIPL